MRMVFRKIYGATFIDKWFLRQIEDIVNEEKNLIGTALNGLNQDAFYTLKIKGFSDRRIADLLEVEESKVRGYRKDLHGACFKRVDTCAAEFKTSTCYMYSTYLGKCESNPTTNKKDYGSGKCTNRIGQGIEFDYCCVHASMAMQEQGYESIMVNCNPETVSTDYDVSDRLYFGFHYIRKDFRYY